MSQFLKHLDIVNHVNPPTACSTHPDLIFNFGYLTLRVGGYRWAAISGSTRLRALPTGWYRCSNFRRRTVRAMVRDGIGFSVDLDPLFETDRFDLRIHPDGGPAGTAGCIGITDPDVRGCALALKRLLPFSSSVAYLQVRTEF